MDAMEAILSRRSIRRYTSQKVSDQMVKELLEAAMSAPSAGNEQPWHFVLIDDRKILQEIPRFHPYSAMLNGAPMAILVCVDLDAGTEGFLVQDGSAATENILIAANGKGLGTVLAGDLSFEREDSRDAQTSQYSRPDSSTFSDCHRLSRRRNFEGRPLSSVKGPSKQIVRVVFVTCLLVYFQPRKMAGECPVPPMAG